MNNHILTYLLEASICHAFFYLGYVLFLKKETYFNLNRAYLILTLLASVAIPTIQIKSEVLIVNTTSPINSLVIPIQAATHLMENKIESRVDIVSILFITYLLVVLVVLIKCLYQFFRLLMFIKKGKISVIQRHYLICTDGQYPTSSFFKYILWDNTVALSDKEIEQIIKHEMTHINQFHTIDNLLMECVGILFWFNPIIYLYNKELKQVHEYLADNEVVSAQKFTADEYKILINKQILNNIGFQLSNNFNMSNLKNRIAMMTKPKSGKLAMLKLSIAIPAAALMMLSFSTVKETIIKENEATEHLNISFYQGTYRGQNLKVHNPSSTTTGDPGYSIKKISVNDKLVKNAEQCRFDNFEIDLNALNLEQGGKVKIEIEYLDELPVLTNLQAIQSLDNISNVRAVVAGTNFQLGYMSKEELLAAGELEVTNDKYVLKSYGMTLKINKLYLELKTNDPSFSKMMRDYLKKTNVGDTIMFEDIHAQAFDKYENYGSIVKLSGVYVIIK
jgi:beta-lactamase regulating signal transducer with metallopeptidase domain